MKLARISITVARDVLAAADGRARELDRSRSWVVAEALRRFVREPQIEYEAPVDAAREVAEARRRHLLADLKLPPAERLRRAEELGRLARAAQRRARRHQVIGFDTYEDFYEWKKARLVGA
jgi:predicted transcriptional regulator